MIRTDATLVAGIIEVDLDIPLDPFISVASELVDVIDAKAVLTTERLIKIETWLSAHFYCMRDPRAEREEAGSVRATYQSKVDLFLSTSHYGQMAMVLDTTNTLRAMSKGAMQPGVTWLGTPIPNEI